MLAGTQPSRSEEVGNPGRGPLWRYTLEKNVRRSRNEVKGQLRLGPKRLSFVGDTSRRKSFLSGVPASPLWLPEFLLDCPLGLLLQASVQTAIMPVP